MQQMRECAYICVSVHPQVRVSCVFTNFPFFWESQDGDLAIAPPLHPLPPIAGFSFAYFVVVLLWRFCWHYRKCFIALPLHLLPSLSLHLHASLSRMHMCNAFSQKLNATLRRRDSIAWLMLIICYSTGEKRWKMQENGKNRSGKHTHIFWKTRTWDVQLLAISGRTAPKK